MGQKRKFTYKSYLPLFTDGIAAFVIDRSVFWLIDSGLLNPVEVRVRGFGGTFSGICGVSSSSGELWGVVFSDSADIRPADFSSLFDVMSTASSALRSECELML